MVSLSFAACCLDYPSKANEPRLEHDQLPENGYRKLKLKRYLITLDDIWSMEAWDLVRRSFPHDENGSQIMITTRFLEVADYASNGCPPHHIHFLNHEDSWKLLCNKVVVKEDCPPQLEEIGKKIAEQCQGLAILAQPRAVFRSTPEQCFSDIGFELQLLVM
ncbi:putative late blight resistance protein homolog R1A-3 [Nicotiana tabacum]|uniref:Late blight resistance protein homolog R1A-3 n=1 Tax=Nicotiana tabacum TaxID=4097 RepID=A0AC58SF35_TOBAC